MEKNITGAKMSDIPRQERPYEKCERFGSGTLSDSELLAILLRSGAEGISALEMSRAVLESLGSGGIARLHNISLEDLQKIRGIGKVKALQIRCIAELSKRIAQAKIGAEDDLVYDNPEVIGSYYMEEMRHEMQEIPEQQGEAAWQKGHFQRKREYRDPSSQGDLYRSFVPPGRFHHSSA